jgi:hypothetical protein
MARKLSAVGSLTKYRSMKSVTQRLKDAIDIRLRGAQSQSFGVA